VLSSEFPAAGLKLDSSVSRRQHGGRRLKNAGVTVVGAASMDGWIYTAQRNYFGVRFVFRRVREDIK